MSFIEDNGYLIVNGEKSSDYGVWVNGSGTYNAPVRRVKEYVVPGRNGTLTIDEGVFEDIDHVYPAFIPRDFSKNIEAFRNMLMANGGYMDLEDSYHPDEYYRAKYISGLDVDVAPGAQGGAFNLRFRRDPRRFLKVGEKVINYPYGEKPSPNLLLRPYYDSDGHTHSGVTFNVDYNGIVTSRGYRETSSNAQFTLQNTMKLPVGTYILSGCPKGGSTSTYWIIARRKTSATSSATEIGRDYGDGFEFEVTNDTYFYNFAIQINQPDAGNLTFKPMIRNKYGESIIPYPYYDGASLSVYGVNFSASNGEITAGGTSTSNSCTYRIQRSNEKKIALKQGVEYRLTGCPTGGSSSTYYLSVSTGGGATAKDYGDGAIFTPMVDLYANVEIHVRSGTTVNNLTFFPQLQYNTPAEKIDYVPYWNMETAIYNPTRFESKPLLYVECNGGTVTIGDNVITINGGDLYIDSETQECYIGSTNRSSDVSFSTHKFPVLKPGANNVTFSGNVASVRITPRWWII